MATGITAVTMRTSCILRGTLERAPVSDGEGEEDNSQQDDPLDRVGGKANTPRNQGPSSSHRSDKHLHPHPISWGSKCESEGLEQSERTVTQEDDMEEEGSSESESSSDGDADDEDAGEELKQTSLQTSQKSEEPPASELTGVESSTGEAGLGATEEVKPVDDAGMEDIEFSLSKATSTTGDLTPTLSQDTVEVHTPEEEVWSLD